MRRAAWRPSLRRLSTLSYRAAAADCVREVPTPLLFVAAPAWSGTPPARELYKPWLEPLATRGFSVMLLDLAPEVPPGTSVLAAMEREMSATLAKPPQGGPRRRSPLL